jgi:hypothetical protein
MHVPATGSTQLSQHTRAAETILRLEKEDLIAECVGQVLDHLKKLQER